MDISRKGPAAVERQEGQRIAGELDAADHRAAHRKQDQDHKRGLYSAHGGIPAFEHAAMPMPVQNMVQDKQRKCPDSKPLMGGLSNQLIGHEKQQGDCHGYIHRCFQNLFCFHALCLLFLAHRVSRLFPGCQAIALYLPRLHR